MMMKKSRLLDCVELKKMPILLARKGRDLPPSQEHLHHSKELFSGAGRYCRRKLLCPSGAQNGAKELLGEEKDSDDTK